MDNHSHHGHDHSQDFDSIKNLKVAFILNLAFVFIEIAGGLFTNSVAILSDAIHDLGDSVSLGLAWYLEKFSQKKGDNKFTYGYKRLSILGALFNSIVLLVGTVFIVYRAIPRIFHPESVRPGGMLILAIVGIVINGLAVLRVRKGKKLAEKVVSLHLLEDLFGWIAVLIVSIVLMFVDVPILDPILSLLISIYVVKNVVTGLRKIIKMLLQGVPDNFDIDETRNYILENNKNVLELHDIKAWTLDGDENIITFHMCVEDNMTVTELVELKRNIKSQLMIKGLNSVTIDVENLNNCSNNNAEHNDEHNH